MNTLVVYASHFGNTERLARRIAAALSVFGPIDVVSVDQVHAAALKQKDVLILASPTEAFRPMPTMHAFLENLSPKALAHLSIACFDTRIRMPFPLNGSAAKGMARQLRQKGVKCLVPPESFYVQSVKGTQGAALLPGEEERAVQWAVSLHQTYAPAHPPVTVR